MFLCSISDESSMYLIDMPYKQAMLARKLPGWAAEFPLLGCLKLVDAHAHPRAMHGTRPASLAEPPERLVFKALQLTCDAVVSHRHVVSIALTLA